jgi:hypothetical protein
MVPPRAGISGGRNQRQRTKPNPKTDRHCCCLHRLCSIARKTSSTGRLPKRSCSRISDGWPTHSSTTTRSMRLMIKSNSCQQRPRDPRQPRASFIRRGRIKRHAAAQTGIVSGNHPLFKAENTFSPRARQKTPEITRFSKLRTRLCRRM